MRGGMRNPMPEQPADVRNKNFKEVALGYDMKTAVDEAERCLHCPKPLCVSGCPVNVEIPAFIQAVKDKTFDRNRLGLSLGYVISPTFSVEGGYMLQSLKSSKSDHLMIGLTINNLYMTNSGMMR